ncbi:MAG: cytochrome c3 family protein [Verrucomicrobiota bacterium]|nr:cytochrome c3 family protein [Verrucomicrobiota bacterium]
MANFFPKWTNKLPVQILIGVVLIATFNVLGIWYWFTPKFTRVGYQPEQPIPFSHAIHVKQLGMDCRYCHSFVEVSGHSNIPTTQTCMNCHSHVQKDNPKLAVLRESHEKGIPIKWVKVHQLPDYVYFNHSVHVNRGVSCVSCHGQVNEMDVVEHVKTFSMDFCLECHKNPEHAVRKNEDVFNLDWKPGREQRQESLGKNLVHDWKVNPPINCAGCHR